MLFDKVAKIIAESREIDPSLITPETTFEELGLDSLDTVELVMRFEEDFHVTVEGTEGVRTISDAVELLKKAGAED